MSRSTLETDLTMNAHDRLVMWRRDTIMRCQAVELGFEAQTSMVYTCLVGELVRLTVMLEMKEEDFCILMHHALQSYRKMEAKNKSAEVEKSP